jgi:2-polyprenyl-6-methoxyphenol hydroxylase-like FAD-dependent oxidoreductase
MDPITGQGISDAFRDAELLADAIVAGRPLAEYQAARDAAVLPMYEFTMQLAAFTPAPPEAKALFQALVGRPEEIARFFGVLSGATPMPDYFTPRNLVRILGLRALARVLATKLRPPVRSTSPAR